VGARRAPLLAVVKIERIFETVWSVRPYISISV